MANHRLLPLASFEAEKTVRDYWKDEGGWRWDEFSHALPNSSLIKIADVVLSAVGDEQDKVCWLGPNNRGFTVKSAYRLLRGELSEGSWQGWKLIWRLRTQEWTKTFLWLLAHDGILTNGARWQRHVSNFPGCVRCQETIEDALHAIRDCKDSSEVWLSFIPKPLQKDFFTLSFQDWLLSNLRFRDDAFYGGRWPENMATICWVIWKWRCQKVFEMEGLNCSQKIEQIRMLLREMESVYVTCPPSLRGWSMNM